MSSWSLWSRGTAPTTCKTDESPSLKSTFSDWFSASRTETKRSIAQTLKSRASSYFSSAQSATGGWAVPLATAGGTLAASYLVPRGLVSLGLTALNLGQAIQHGIAATSSFSNAISHASTSAGSEEDSLDSQDHTAKAKKGFHHACMEASRAGTSCLELATRVTLSTFGAPGWVAAGVGTAAKKVADDAIPHASNWVWDGVNELRVSAQDLGNDAENLYRQGTDEATRAAADLHRGADSAWRYAQKQCDDTAASLGSHIRRAASYVA